MRVLALTNMYPTHGDVTSGVFVEQQVEGLKQHDVKVDVLLIDRKQRGILEYFRAIPKIVSQAQSVDLVHVMYGGVLSMIAGYAVRKRPFVVTFHGSDLLGENNSGIVRRFLSRLGVWASWIAAWKSTAVVVVSTRLRDAIPRFIRREKIHVIPCGINLNRFSYSDSKVAKEKLGLDGEKFHVLFQFGSGDKVKRPELAQQAVERLERMGVPVQMHILQGIPNHIMPVWLSAGDLLLLTSSHEGSPTIVKEALACNLPVVSVDVGDVSDRIGSVAGCHLALPTPEDLASKLKKVFDARRRVDGRSAVAELSLAHIATRLIALYRSCSSRLPLGKEELKFGDVR